jgi:hypothetical protein
MESSIADSSSDTDKISPPPEALKPNPNPPKKSTAIGCHCKKSKCLKLYCECFAALKYCDPRCACVDCGNNLANEDRRLAAIDKTKRNNNDPFSSKKGSVCR